MGIPDHLTCFLKNMNAGQEATVRTRHGTVDWFQIGKGVHQGCISSPCLFNVYVEYIMGNAMLDEAQAEIKIAGENINILYWYFWNIKICRWYHPYGWKQRGNKEPLDESEWEEGKSLLKTQNSRHENHGIWSHHFMANRFENNGKNDRLYFGVLKNHCRWWLKPWI